MCGVFMYDGEHQIFRAVRGPYTYICNVRSKINSTGPGGSIVINSPYCFLNGKKLYYGMKSFCIRILYT